MDGNRLNNLERENLQALIEERIMKKLSASIEADEAHPYLRDHRIDSHDLSVDKKGNLLAVGVDLKASFTDKGYNPHATTMLTIAPSGETKLEKWSTTTGAAIMIGHQDFRYIGKDPDQAYLIFVIEDYPNGAFLFEHFGIPVAVALRLSNIKGIVEIFREKFSKAQIIVLLNSDPETTTRHSQVSVDCKKAGAIVLHSHFIKRKPGVDFFSCSCRALIPSPSMVSNNIYECLQAEIALLKAASNQPLCAA